MMSNGGSFVLDKGKLVFKTQMSLQGKRTRCACKKRNEVENVT